MIMLHACVSGAGLGWELLSGEEEEEEDGVEDSVGREKPEREREDGTLTLCL